MCQVGKLMDDYVLNECRLCHHQTPVEAQRAVRGAASPLPAVVADENS